MRRLGGALAAVVVTVGSLVALGAVPATPTSSSVAALVPPPASMAAIGDSFSHGFATGAPDCNVFMACPQYSWSVGTAVNSHYQRLLALNPALAGHATNAALPGSSMSAFVTQVGTIAASQPDYVTVLLGGGDICFGPTPTATFRAQFRAGMDALLAASPNSKVLVASIWSFESIRAAVLAGNPGATWFFCGIFFNATPAARALLTAQIVDYNAALEAECATYTNCLFDGNALFNHVWSAAEVSTVDNFHPSVAGQKMLSEVLYNAGYRWGIEPAAAPVATVVRFTG